jgi:kynurenine formamidase
MKFIDLTHTLSHDMPVFPGDPAPELRQTARVENEGYAHYQIKTGMHAGTHIDAPFHMISGGKKISEFPPEKFIARGILLDARGQNKIEASLLEGRNIQPGNVIIVLTGWYKNFGQPEYFVDAPLVTAEFAEKLASLKVSMLGLDTPTPDQSPFLIHKILLGNEILIIENLTHTEELLEFPNFEIIALPLKIDADGSPARVIAKLY